MKRLENVTIQVGGEDLFCHVLEYDADLMTAIVSVDFAESKPKPKYTSILMLNYWWGKK